MATKTDMIVVTVNDQPVNCKRGQCLFDALKGNSLPIETACDGIGSCHLCRVSIQKGQSSLPPPTSIEKRALGSVLLAQGMRLACQLPVTTPLTVKIPTRYRKSSQS